MLLRYVVACLVILLVVLEIVHGKSPGFKARITSKGFDYANKVAMDSLAARISTFRVPDQHGNGGGGVSYDLTNLRVTGFTKPTSNIVFLPGTGLKWTANGAGASMKGDFHYAIRKKWIPTIRDGGSFDISISGLDFSINMDLGVDTNGRPKISSNGCICEISSVNIKFHGGLSWLYNLFRNNLGSSVKKNLKNSICDSVTKQINEDGEKKLAALPVTTKLANKFLLDYRLLQQPRFSQSYMETFHEGEIYWKGDETDSPLRPPAMAETGENQKMMYLWVSDYMFNTIGYAAQKHNFLVKNITSEDLSPDDRGILNTTCTSFMCLGTLIPQIGKAYPNCKVELDMSSGSPPMMTITTNGIGVHCDGEIVFYARPKNSNLAYSLLTVKATMDITVNSSISNELLYAKIKDMEFHMDVIHSDVGKINVKALQLIANGVLKSALLPKINDLGKKGFPLPVTGKIQFANTALKLIDHALLIGTDLVYHP